MENFEFPDENFRKRRLSLSGVTFSVGAAVPFLISLLISFAIVVIVGSSFASEDYPDWYIYLAFLVSPISLGLTAVFYFYKSKEKVTVLLKPCKWQYFLIAFLLEFGLLFSFSEIGNIFVMGLEELGYKPSGIDLPDLSGAKVIPAIIVIALLPAIFEEVFFRGIFVRNMHACGWGTVATVLISGALFSLFHGNPEQTVYQFICGACFALVAIRAGSILPTMIAHFLNNAIILILTSCGVETLGQLGMVVFPIILTLSVLCFVGTMVYLIFFDKSNNQKGKVKGGKAFFVTASVGIVLLGVEWIFALITGFYG